MDLEERRKELGREIELSCGFEELRKNLEEFEEMEKWEPNEEIERRGEIDNQLPIIQEENGNDLGKAFLEIEENGGDQIPSSTQQEINGESLRILESVGEEIITTEEMNGEIED